MTKSKSLAKTATSTTAASSTTIKTAIVRSNDVVFAPKAPCVKVIKLINGNSPVGYVCFLANSDGNIEASIAAKDPKDKWNPRVGYSLARKRFADPKHRMLLKPSSPISSFESTRRAVLDCLVHSDHRVSDKARKAAKSMLNELSGDSLRKAVRSFMNSSSGKSSHKTKLVREIFEQEIAGLISVSANPTSR